MATAKYSGVDHYTGLSTDTKPESVPGNTIKLGSTLIEEDTHHLYQYGATGWFLKAATLNSEETEGTRVGVHVNDDPGTSLLSNILHELKKINMHLQIITDEKIENNEVE